METLTEKLGFNLWYIFSWNPCYSFFWTCVSQQKLTTCLLHYQNSGLDLNISPEPTGERETNYPQSTQLKGPKKTAGPHLAHTACRWVVFMLTECCDSQYERDHDGDPGDPERLLPVALCLMGLQAHAALQKTCTETHTVLCEKKIPVVFFLHFYYVRFIALTCDGMQPKIKNILWYF